MPRRLFAPGAVIYDRSMSARYRSGRALSREAAGVWRDAIASFVPRTPARIADLGAGTGRFVPVLASFVGAKVVAVEPSIEMLNVAVEDRPGSNVRYMAGRTERLPLATASCEVLWLSQSYHHVADRGDAARELRRVGRRGGVVLIRNTFSDRLGGFPTLYHFFPGARQLSTNLPTVPQTVALFGANGMVLECEQRVEQQTCASLREFEERTRQRADSSLALLTDEEFEAGLQSVSRAAALEVAPVPVMEALTLLVFRIP